MVAATLAAVATNVHAEATAFFRDLVHVETRLYNALDEHLKQHHGIVTSQFGFLQHVRDHPGVRVVDLYADADNAAALRTYERLGFTRVATDVVYEGRP